MKYLSKKAKFYISIIVVLGAFMAIYFIQFNSIIINFDTFIFLIMAIIAESLIIPLPKQGGLTVGFAIVLPAIIFFGPGVALTIIALSNILLVVKDGDSYIHIFNIPFY